MKIERRRAIWQSRVPAVADPAFCESVIRVTSKRPEMWGYVLAEVRASRGWSLTDQAMALGVSPSALVFLSVCRVPRSGHCDEDVVAIADRMGIQAAVLRFVLELATGSSGVVKRGVTAGGAA